MQLHHHRDKKLMLCEIIVWENVSQFAGSNAATASSSAELHLASFKFIWLIYFVVFKHACWERFLCGISVLSQSILFLL